MCYNACALIEILQIVQLQSPLLYELTPFLFYIKVFVVLQLETLCRFTVQFYNALSVVESTSRVITHAH